ncbi:MAG: alpha/beta hydrolase [Sciscionella sp.]
MPVLAGAEPFSHGGNGDIGVLLCHGFTGCPQSMRPWGEHLAAAGFAVRCPLLPGHGTSWRDCNRTGWADWYGSVERELLSLAEQCRSVFVFGQSMGGTLSLRLAQRHQQTVAGLVLVNPSVTTLRKDAMLLPLLSKVLGSMPGIGSDIAKTGSSELAYDRLPLRAAASLSQLWKAVRHDLDQVRAPLLLLRSASDHVVEQVNAQIVLRGVGSEDVREFTLENSFHVATLDNDAPTIFAMSVQFARRVHGERAEQVR